MERKVAVTNLEQEEHNKEEALQSKTEESTFSENRTSPLSSDNLVEPNESDKEGQSQQDILKTTSSSEEDPVPEAEAESIGTEEGEKVAEVDSTLETSAETPDESAALPETDAESQKVEEEEEESITEQPSSSEETTEVETEESTAGFYQELLAKAKEFVTMDDWAYVSNELANLALYISEGPSPDDEASKAAIAEFNALREDFEERKRAHYEELKKKKEANLALKKELLKQFSELITQEKWTATKEVNQIRSQWESIKLLPQGEVDALNERFESLMQEFESHKVDRLVKKLQKEEENFALKLVILEKMDALNTQADHPEANFKELEAEFHDLIVQWRKIGRVPAEKNQQVWEHYNTAQDTFNKLRFKNDKKYRESVERALRKKKKLVEEAEALIDNPDIAEASRLVNKLHKAWKKTGNLPQKEENELWEKFKAATDAFNEKKAENIEILREQEQKNLALKMALIEKARAMKTTDDYEEGHQTMQRLMEEWKEIGPVPRKKSSKVWKQFKEAMDDFYEERRKHFKDIRKEQKENLTRKNEIIAKLEELAESEDPALAVEEAKKLQTEFKNIGHVPLKHKNKIWKRYREVCDRIYGNFRASGNDLNMERRLASEGIEPGARKEIVKFQKELEHHRKEVSRLEAEMIQYEEAKTYFKPTNKGNKLRDELQAKVDNAVEKIALEKKKISELVRKINELKEISDTNED